MGRWGGEGGQWGWGGGEGGEAEKPERGRGEAERVRMLLCGATRAGGEMTCAPCETCGQAAKHGGGTDLNRFRREQIGRCERDGDGGAKDHDLRGVQLSSRPCDPVEHRHVALHPAQGDGHLRILALLRSGHEATRERRHCVEGESAKAAITLRPINLRRLEHLCLLQYGDEPRKVCQVDPHPAVWAEGGIGTHDGLGGRLDAEAIKHDEQ